jgi:hypothetical protein
VWLSPQDFPTYERNSFNRRYVAELKKKQVNAPAVVSPPASSSPKMLRLLRLLAVELKGSTMALRPRRGSHPFPKRWSKWHVIGLVLSTSVVMSQFMQSVAFPCRLHNHQHHLFYCPRSLAKWQSRLLNLHLQSDHYAPVFIATALTTLK